MRILGVRVADRVVRRPRAGGNGLFIFFVLGVMAFVLVIAWAVVGVHALLLGRVPGSWLRRGVRQPRLWGAGALLILFSGIGDSPSLLAVGIGLVALGYVVKPAR